MTDAALAGALTEAERTLGKDPSDAVLRHARETLALAEPFLSAEPRLAQQVEALRTRLAAAETPRTVRLESDGKTTVQVLKVRHLGALTEQALPLRPGNYIALGSRDGYRDVRVSFTVPWKQPRPPSPWFAEIASSMTSEPIAPSPYVPGSAPPPPEERRRRRRWPWFAALLLLPLAFVFLAQGLTVQVTPREASVSLSGGPYVTLADRYLVLPGTYTLRATAPGYEPYRQPLLVEAGSPPQVRLALQPAAGEVTVAVQGVSGTALPHAEITLTDGQTRRADGEPLTLHAGPQALTVRAKDYEPQSFILTVAGRGRAQTALVQLERRWAELALETDPEGAEV